MEKNILQTIFPNIKDLEKQAEAWDDLGLSTRMNELAGATDKLSGIFEDAVTNSDKWQKAELKIKTAENNLAKISNKEKLLSINKEVIASKSGIEIQNGLMLAMEHLFAGTEAGKKLDYKNLRDFVENDAWVGNWEFGDLFKTMGLEEDGSKGLGPDPLIAASMDKFVRQATGASEDQSAAFLEQLTQQEKMSMTFKGMKTLFDTWFEKGQLEKKAEHMQSIVTGTEQKEAAVKIAKENLNKTLNPEDKKSEVVSTLSPGVEEYNKFIHLLPPGSDGKNPTATTDGSKTVAAINNLTAAIGDKPIVIEIDGKEITKALYNQSMKGS
jgi:hypothetical protein